ncbi:MAG TPA: 4-hydroxy-3-methylbut-2-enyl diphosphate reductase [Phycisphaerales bacterium]|nr:MAG: 4-hydroxy-3-methylbut-2-enyl diphosphate reductase [Planctomycetes bacterium GWC2_45_44]HBG77945.1 4-hydroxy-3-methylbut-2-enyl diphosphate reductase [Phycisphaerales bacterium]HBR19897.1 4-hydroxy-3-methylbut-2-enyl diphosphate reductase [Phycisphaerales bacterium]
MKVIVADGCGFCPGVRNAIKIASETLAKKKNVYSLGEIIHNKDVVKQLADSGLKISENIKKIPSGTVIIRSHGAGEQQLKQIRKQGLKIVDATCILVKRVQKIAKMLHKQGYKVVIIGDNGHPEVQAVLGSAPDIDVIGNDKDIANLPRNKKLGIICQTTQSPEHFATMLEKIAKTPFSELKVINTLCKEAIKRQTCAVELCQKVDVMFILGGLHSANTKKLAELCKKYNKKTFHLQNFKELDTSTLLGNSTAGVTAGASTPQWVIDEFVENLARFDTGKKRNS